MSDGIKAAREQLFETDKTPKRVTAMERREREAVARETQRLQDQEAALKAWPERLMKNLERAGKQGWSFYVTNSRFVVHARTSRDDVEDLRFGYTPVGRFELWNQDNDWYAMDELERYLDNAEEAEREAQRVAQVRAGALNKLTAEEREALGL